MRIGAFIDENVGIFNGVKSEPRSFDLLDGLLNLQVYRLSSWRVAMDEINYRRFFDINGLAAIRMEDPAMFEETHRLLFRLISQGNVPGLRVDQAGGLYHPCAYLNMLQRGCYPPAAGRHRTTGHRSCGTSPRPGSSFPGASRSVPHGQRV